MLVTMVKYLNRNNKHNGSGREALEVREGDPPVQIEVDRIDDPDDIVLVTFGRRFFSSTKVALAITARYLRWR